MSLAVARPPRLPANFCAQARQTAMVGALPCRRNAHPRHFHEKSTMFQAHYASKPASGLPWPPQFPNASRCLPDVSQMPPQSLFGVSCWGHFIFQYNIEVTKRRQKYKPNYQNIIPQLSQTCAFGGPFSHYVVTLLVPGAPWGHFGSPGWFLSSFRAKKESNIGSMLDVCLLKCASIFESLFGNLPRALFAICCSLCAPFQRQK